MDRRELDKMLTLMLSDAWYLYDYKLRESVDDPKKKFGSIGVVRAYCTALQKLEEHKKTVTTIMEELEDAMVREGAKFPYPLIFKDQLKYYNDSLIELNGRIKKYRALADPCKINYQYAQYIRTKRKGKNPLLKWSRNRKKLIEIIWGEKPLASIFGSLVYHLQQVIAGAKNLSVLRPIQVEDLVYKGFRVRLVRNVQRTLFKDELERLNLFKGALTFVQKRLKKYAPKLLKTFPTIVYSIQPGSYGRIYAGEKILEEESFEEEIESTGFYVPEGNSSYSPFNLEGYIFVKGYGRWIGEVKRLSRTIVHEAAHAFYYEDMTKEQRERWEELFDLEEMFDLREIYMLHEKEVPFADYPYEYQHIIQKYGLGYLLSQVDKGNHLLSIPVIRPSNYGRTNASEAFAEIIANVIVVGPRAVNEHAWKYLKVLVGDTLRRNTRKSKTKTSAQSWRN
jgi:hypothetical protein